MDIRNETILNFGFFTEDTDEAATFTNIWTKLYRETKKTGFKNMFNPKEKELIQEMHLQWFGSEPKPDGINSLSNNQMFAGNEV
jgi:hypothetical protein